MHQFILLFAGKFSVDADATPEEKAVALAAKRADILAVETPLLAVETMELDLAVYQIDDERKLGPNV